ncbi:YihY/virulence factor BrkB family protein [Sinobaca sp. H24]|uniref:YihY/virulence factor BrkB family protein n=1 Tax=Sinobaca sp. H24 TaxID=2923376 RepID=UPI0027E3824E|nr:YihY/virulence factor BrkB family protein [Sinobaca sp. H24]
MIIIVSSALSFLYYFATSMRFPLRHVIPGALVATILWQGVSFGFSVYISNFGNFSATYGSLGGIIVLMLWLYLTGFTFIIGGEVNAILHRHSKLFHSERFFLRALFRYSLFNILPGIPAVKLVVRLCFKSKPDAAFD